MNDYIEVVYNPDQDRDENGQPWKNRLKSGNHLQTWGTETFRERSGAHASVEDLGRTFSPSGTATLLAADPHTGRSGELHVWLDDREDGPKHVIEVREILDRAPRVRHQHMDAESAKTTRDRVWELQTAIATMIDTPAHTEQQVGSLHALSYVAEQLTAIYGCPARHAETGEPCVEHGLHADHRAMGKQRMQLFGPGLTSGEVRDGDGS